MFQRPQVGPGGGNTHAGMVSQERSDARHFNDADFCRPGLRGDPRAPRQCHRAAARQIHPGGERARFARTKHAQFPASGARGKDVPEGGAGGVLAQAARHDSFQFAWPTCWASANTLRASTTPSGVPPARNELRGSCDGGLRRRQGKRSAQPRCSRRPQTHTVRAIAPPRYALPCVSREDVPVRPIGTARIARTSWRRVVLILVFPAFC
jgi:hypothetical protein